MLKVAFLIWQLASVFIYEPLACETENLSE